MWRWVLSCRVVRKETRHKWVLDKKRRLIKLHRTTSVDISERSQQCSEDAILADSVFRVGHSRPRPCSSLPLFRVIHMVTNEDPSHSHAKPSHATPFTSYVVPSLVMSGSMCRGSMPHRLIKMYCSCMASLSISSDKSLQRDTWVLPQESLQGLHRTRWVYNSLS